MDLSHIFSLPPSKPNSPNTLPFLFLTHLAEAFTKFDELPLAEITIKQSPFLN